LQLTVLLNNLHTNQC